MDEYSAHAFVNRDDPLPLLSADSHDDISDGTEDVTSEEKSGRRQALKERARNFTGRSWSQGTSLQDRLLEKLWQQVIPVEDLGGNHEKASPSAQRSYAERPNFNVATMSTNFRRFNARIGVVFVFQARMIRLLSWQTWSHTLSFLAVYTFVCLDPYLMSVLPLVALLLAVFIPAFITRHPAAPINVSTSFEYTPTGPPIAPAPVVKPVKELSKDFFRNMRDLQNCMEDFSRLHDKVISMLTPPTNFSNEPLSSTIFLFLCLLAALMFIGSHLMPWRLVFLATGWAVTCLGHPRIQTIVLATHKEHIEPREARAKTWLDSWIARDIILDSEPEKREVEIFELQRRTTAGEWESWLFSPTPYDPLSPSRIADERPSGTRFFEDVQAPRGWDWSEKKWTLDLWSREWVEERMITGVEIETEGERWVYDIEYEKVAHVGIAEPLSKKGKAKMPNWEEGTATFGKRGGWRRRRWVRTVKRKNLSGSVDAT
ncbi:MAG: hypothetical protein M1818_006449 [Claussenomyces sp. TS43310]|nr:MAG: hypothetical protein M1818_006449 [Claussenomyces sp. TS43310]